MASLFSLPFLLPKGHACCGYVLVNADITPPLRYQPFGSQAVPWWNGRYLNCSLFPHRSKVRFATFFFTKKHPSATLLLLFCKWPRSYRLTPCKRAVLTSIYSLPTFYEYAPAAHEYLNSPSFLVETSYTYSLFLFLKKPVTCSIVPPLSQKTGSIRLLDYKRTRNGSTLPPFRECAFGVNISLVLPFQAGAKLTLLRLSYSNILPPFSCAIEMPICSLPSFLQ